MDPLGFTFEGYDGTGAFRTLENGKSIDSSGEIVLSCVETAYQLGLDRQAACVVFAENRVSEMRPCTA